jgi:hypothetical protein
MTIDTDQDRYPKLRGVLQAILQDASLEDAEIERLELTSLADGSATYRYWTPRADEPDGGFLAAPQADDPQS